MSKRATSPRTGSVATRSTPWLKRVPPKGSKSQTPTPSSKIWSTLIRCSSTQTKWKNSEWKNSKKSTTRPKYREPATRSEWSIRTFRPRPSSKTPTISTLSFYKTGSQISVSARNSSNKKWTKSSPNENMLIATWIKSLKSPKMKTAKIPNLKLTTTHLRGDSFIDSLTAWYDHL